MIKKVKDKAPTDDTLMIEIQEEINRERMVKFFTRYGFYLAIIGVVLLIAFGGSQWWKNNQIEKRREAGTVLYNSLSEISEKAPDEFTFSNLDAIKDNNSVKGLALLAKAAAYQKNNNFQQAVTTYDAIAKSKADKSIRDLASLNAANLILNTDPKADGLKQRLDNVSSKDNVFKYSGKELLAAYYIQNEQQEKAGEILTTLSKDASAPASITKRARELNPVQAPPVTETEAENAE